MMRKRGKDDENKMVDEEGNKNGWKCVLTKSKVLVKKKQKNVLSLTGSENYLLTCPVNTQWVSWVM